MTQRKQEQKYKFNKVIEQNIKKVKMNRKEILGLKNIKTKWKNSIDNFNSRLKQAKELENRSF